MLLARNLALSCDNRQVYWKSFEDLVMFSMQGNAMELTSSVEVLKRTATLAAWNTLKLCARRRHGPDLKGFSVHQFAKLLDDGRFKQLMYKLWIQQHDSWVRYSSIVKAGSTAFRVRSDAAAEAVFPLESNLRLPQGGACK